MLNDRCEPANVHPEPMPIRSNPAHPRSAPSSEDVQRSSPTDHSSDAQILKAVILALGHTGYAQLCAIQSYCHHGRVVLQGRIATRFLKQVAHDVVRGVPHVKDVDNDLHVICSY